MDTTTVPSSTCLGAWRALVDASAALIGRLESDLERNHDLSLPGYEVLIHLAETPGRRLRLQNLVPHTRLTKSGVSRLVDRLEAQELIRTERCASDGRGNWAVLTETGQARLTAAAADHLRGIEELFGRHLDDSEAALLTSVLLRVRSALPEAAPRCGAGGIESVAKAATGGVTGGE